MSFGVAVGPGVPSRKMRIDFGTLNHTFPFAHALAMSWSPIPCPNAPIAPRMFACESVETIVPPGPTSPSSIAMCVPMPELTS